MEEIVFNEDYYKKVIEEFGYNLLRFGKINFNLGKITDSELRSRWICHLNADKFAKSFSNGEKCIVTTGIGMSGVPHVGTLVQIFNALFIQKNGIKVQMVLGDLDAYNGKLIPLQTVRNLAEKYKEFILNLGFKTDEGSILRDQWSELKILRTMYLCGRYVNDSEFDWTEEDLHEFYVLRGKVDEKMTFRRKLSLLLGV